MFNFLKQQKNNPSHDNCIHDLQLQLNALNSKFDIVQKGNHELREDLQLAFADKVATQANPDVTNAIHKRIDGITTRLMNIEHYLGLRSHSFESGGRQWDFHQIVKDLHIKNRVRPKSIYQKRQGQNKAA